MEKRKTLDQTSTVVITISALVCSFAVLLLGGFIVSQGLPMFSKVPLVQFLFSTDWSPTGDVPNFGILTFFFNTTVVTVLALVFAMPIALSTSIYLALFAKGKTASLLRSAIELLASIPSIIYGLVGMVVIVPIVRSLFGGNGYSILSCAIVLSVMILPTIISVSEVSIRSVRDDLKWASVAMGATTWQTIKGVVLPASRSGIVTALVMGVGRAVGETTAVLLVGGNSPLFPKNLASMGRTLTMNIVTDMSYAAGTHLQALFATAILLFICVLALNILVMKLGKDKNNGR
ncbi:phosphate ABC transporter, permease protein PstC [Sphaerochaeta pleomorpha str. Grapes]|uniref:Phosphate transport system permease protein n=1 Tax=Sphaerochaeta pleomorpha (strain ATCC BAA-1885 / DSM 22778 / Grapes) TaxID=158190 RepID=G8QT37_SPHPG|nr:phosphate ABC transporter permease subunit PstC [Sphaerochaeta pleomorpha]AEV27942.1 phosphate ABC transporter, permease protein PstC [Sphaerochaeta pleomorpha str. Grapes]